MKAHINYDVMKVICTEDISWFSRFGEQHETPTGRYFYWNRGKDVLAVAHLDSVHERNIEFNRITVNGETRVFCQTLDDRLGAYTILHLLPQFGLEYDILLTEGEEIGQSTGNWFETNKQYNWMFSFDRSGDDVVTYQYGTKRLKKLLRKSGFRDIQYGAFSDITSMGHLDCLGFNVGTGYHDEHSRWAWGNMTELKSNAKKFVNFFQQHKKTHLAYNEKTDRVYRFASAYSYDITKPYGGMYNRSMHEDYLSESDKPRHGNDAPYLTPENQREQDLKLLALEGTLKDDEDLWVDGAGNYHIIRSNGQMELIPSVNERLKQHFNMVECIWCGTYVRENLLMDGVCEPCIVHKQPCAGCDEITELKQLNLNGFCPKCVHILSM